MTAIKPIRILALLAILAIIGGLAGCGQPKKKKPVQISLPKGRIAFGQPVPVSERGTIFAPDMAIDPEGRVHIAYIDGYDSIHRVFYVRSDDGGDNFSHTIQLSDKDGIKSSGVELDSLDGSLYAIWTNETDAGVKLSFRESSDGGRNFTREAVFNGSKNPRRYALAGSSGNPLVFYIYSSGRESSIALNRKFNPDNETNVLREGGFRGIKTVTDQYGVYVLILDGVQTAGGTKLRLLRSTDDGGSFTPYELFGGAFLPVYKNAFELGITQGGKSRLHITWLERFGDGVRLMYSRSLTGLEKWSEAVEIASAAKLEDWMCSRSLLATDGLKSVLIVYAYQDRIDDEALYRMAYKLSEDEGETFAAEAVVTQEITSPDMITGAMNRYGTIHIAWDDEDHGEIGERRVYYVRGNVK
jgi:hypothetical protein